MTERFKVQINYRSRNSMVVECDDFEIRGQAPARSFRWENASPTPLMLGIEDIESVWELPND